MARARSLDTDVSGLRRAAAHVKRVRGGAEGARKRALATVQRRLDAETARTVASVQLNVAARSLAPYITVRSGGPQGAEYVSVYGSRDRLPIKLFKPRVSKRDGVRVTLFRRQGEQHWPHAFVDRGVIKQRVPARGANAWRDHGASGLVHRLPIATRVGPSLARALGPVRDRGASYAAFSGREQVVSHLREFAANVLASEIARLTRAGF